MKKQSLSLCALLVALAAIMPSDAFARRKKSHQETSQHEYSQQEYPHQPYQQQQYEKKDRTVLGSALGFSALGAITAGAAGSGKWVPLGLVGGALAGWAIGKAIEHGKKKKMLQKNGHTVRDRKSKKRSK